MVKVGDFQAVLLPCLLILAAALTGCAGETMKGRLTVYAASSLTDAFESIEAAYESTHPGVDVALNFGGSSALALQITQDAPADVFASANEEQAALVAAAGKAVGDLRPFAYNELTVIVPAGGGRITSLESLAAPGLRIVMAAPGIPVREYSDQVLIGLGDLYGDEYAPAVYANLVSEEPNVRQAAAKVALGEADAAWVYSSDVTPDLAGSVREIPLPEGYNIRTAYPILELTDARDPALARDFIAFVLSPEGQAILADAGFIPLAP